MKYLLFVFGICFVQSTFSQKTTGSAVKVKINGVNPKDTLYMASYYGPKQYYKDTAIVDGKGIATFESKEKYPGGIYSIVLPDKKTYFEFLMVESSFSMETVKGDQQVMTEHVKAKDSPENALFFEYLHFISGKQKESEPYRKVMTDSLASAEKKEEAKKQLNSIDDAVIAYKKNLIKNNPNAFVTKVLSVSQEPEVPENWPLKENGDKDSSFPRKYFMSHFWDGIDFSDERLLRTPVFHNKLERYMTKLTVQVPDSINRSADYVCNKARANKEVFKYVVHFITNHFEKSQIMGMDAVFVHMGENYYMTGDAYWMDSTQIAKVSERVRKTKPTLLGNIAPNLILQDSAEVNWINLKNVKSKYTILYFWDSGCGHCKKETPKLKELYKKVKDKGVEVYAVGTELENAAWKKYIRENQLDWINVSDNPEINKNAYKYLQYTTIESLNFRDTYDIYSTPRVFLLDENKKILAKRIGVEQLEEMLNTLFKKEEAKK